MLFVVGGTVCSSVGNNPCCERKTTTADKSGSKGSTATWYDGTGE